VADGETVRYGIADGSNFETGYGVYTASGTTLTRNPQISSNSNAAISLSGAATVFIGACAEDFKTTNPNFIYNPPFASQFTDQTVYGRSSSSTGMTVTDSNAGLQLIDGTADSTGFKTNIRAATINSSFYLIAKCQLNLYGSNLGGGICVANGSGDCVMWNLSTVNSLALYNPYWKSGGWSDNNYGIQANGKQWLKLSYDGTNYHFYASIDGVSWYEPYSALAASAGCPSPTKYGFTTFRYGGSGACSMTVPYFSSNEFVAPSPGYMR
jgi:hypothetical protein